MRRASLYHRTLIGALIVAAAAVATTVIGTADAPDQFPHERHARLFPLCIGCHAGAETGDPATLHPSPESCTGCHDGRVQPRVEWQQPAEHLSNLAFTHPAHERRVAANGEAPLECEQCHTAAGAPRMAVQRANPQICFSCHAHPASDHYADARCETCHVAFVRSELPPSRLIDLPRPADHDNANFLRALHGEQAEAGTARCATCHVRERCTSCHVNADDVREIGALPVAPQQWTLPAWQAVYPEPASHLDRKWLVRHGDSASRRECAACHTREDCTVCHSPPVKEIINTLPARSETVAPGAGTERQMPLSHASRFFAREHAAFAASEPQSCSTCHQKSFCTDCHDKPIEPSYHPRNFTAQHASAAYGRRLECSSCHEVRTFCRACHIQEGMRTEGRLDPGFHDAEPLWLLRHARAARQGLESCTACHNQRDCLQCHSTLGAFRISPHGPDFDARRAQKRNPTICFACHVTDPLGGGGSN